MPWSATRHASENIVHVRYSLELSVDDGDQSLKRVLELMGTDDCHLEFDLRDMLGYQTGARVAWQRGLWANRKRVLSFGLIGGKPLLRQAAQMIGFVLGIKVRSVDAPPSSEVA